MVRDLRVRPSRGRRQRRIRLPEGSTGLRRGAGPPPSPPPAPIERDPHTDPGAQPLPGHRRDEAQRRLGAAELQVHGPRTPPLPPLPLVIVAGAVAQRGGGRAAERPRRGRREPAAAPPGGRDAHPGSGHRPWPRPPRRRLPPCLRLRPDGRAAPRPPRQSSAAAPGLNSPRAVALRRRRA